MNTYKKMIKEVLKELNHHKLYTKDYIIEYTLFKFKLEDNKTNRIHLSRALSSLKNSQFSKRLNIIFINTPANSYCILKLKPHTKQEQHKTP